MKYAKTPLSIEQQIAKLKQQGLVIKNDTFAADVLSNISYYRLKAYSFPFQDCEDQLFIKDDINFVDIVSLYRFDCRLRTLIFHALAKIEISLRTKLIREYSIETGNSHWFTDKSLYFNLDKFDFIMEKIGDDVNRSDEDFIKHYQAKYSSPDLPPAWMTLETLSFGNISKLIANLDCKSTPYKNVSMAFGLPNSFILENWIYSFSVLRNYCAHHSRIWNRRFHVEMKLPYNTVFPFIDKKMLSSIHKNKLFAVLSSIQYIIKIISPENDLKNTLIKTISEGGKLLQIKDMGFPENWQTFGVWK